MPADALLESDAADDPLAQWERWYAEARAGVARFDVMALATATADGAPSVRMVLLKGADARGFTFFSNYESRKGGELAANPRAALLLHWAELGRQVRVEGAVERLAEEESDAYFATRPLGARLSASVSQQSEVVGSRDDLENAVAALRARGEELGRPPHWGGYLLVPAVYEFWQHRDDRLHDRLRYRRAGNAWVRERLAP